MAKAGIRVNKPKRGPKPGFKHSVKKLGVPWATMEVGQVVVYWGTYDGLKVGVCIQNRKRAPKKFKMTLNEDNLPSVTRIR